MRRGLAPAGRLRPWEVDRARQRLRAEAVTRMAERIKAEDFRYPHNVDLLAMLPDGRVGRVRTGSHGLLGAAWRYSARGPWLPARARVHGGWLAVRVLSEPRAKVAMIIEPMGGARNG